jgi:acetolactate synthase-1/2/3 large subunit
MHQGRPGPAAIECAIDVWGKRGPVEAIVPPSSARGPKINSDKVRAAAKLLGKGKRILIVAGGGAQDASPEVTLLSSMLQAPVLGYRRGRGVLDSRDPLSVTLPLGRDLWAEADVVLAVGTRLHTPLTAWGVDKNLQIVRVDADPEQPARLHRPNVALIGDTAPILRSLIDELAKFNIRRASRRHEMQERQAQLRQRLNKIAPQLAFLDAIRTELPEDGIYVDEVTQIGFAARLASPFTNLARFSHRVIRTIWAGVMPPRSARSMQGWMYRCSRSMGMEASSIPAMNSPPPCGTVYRLSPWSLPMALSEMCAASSKNNSATG